MNFLLQLLIAVLASGAFASLVTAFINRRQRAAEVRQVMSLVDKTDAETGQIVVSTYQQAVDIAMNLARGLSERIAELEGDLRDEQTARSALQDRLSLLEGRYLALLSGVRVLLGQLYEANITPRWKPEEDEDAFTV